MSNQNFSIAGGLKYEYAIDEETGRHRIDMEQEYHCDYCGGRIWKGHSVTYDDDPKVFSLCNPCLPKMFANPEEGKVLMLDRIMAKSANIED